VLAALPTHLEAVAQQGDRHFLAPGRSAPATGEAYSPLPANNEIDIRMSSKNDVILSCRMTAENRDNVRITFFLNTSAVRSIF
jgi:hypothetical protein